MALQQVGLAKKYLFTMDSSAVITITNNSGSVHPAQKILTNTGSSRNLPANYVASFIWESNGSVWVLSSINGDVVGPNSATDNAVPSSMEQLVN